MEYLSGQACDFVHVENSVKKSRINKIRANPISSKCTKKDEGGFAPTPSCSCKKLRVFQAGLTEVQIGSFR